MDKENEVLLEVRDSIAWLTLNRPERRNAINSAMHQALRSALQRIEADNGIGAVVLTGAGQAFCAGQDLSERAAMLEQGDVDLGESLERNYNPLVRRLAALPMPVIAAVNGVASGAGAAIAIGCDVVLAANTASFHFPFAKVALGLDCASSWLLPRLVGQSRALAIALTAEPLQASEALHIGLVWKISEPAALRDEAERIAGNFVEGPRQALAAIKRSVRDAAGITFDQALQIEREAQQRLGRLSDYREAVTSFMAKRPPRFLERS